jgi:hypothetical protein
MQNDESFINSQMKIFEQINIQRRQSVREEVSAENV